MEKINPEYIAQFRRLIGEWIREFRNDKGLKQRQVADMLGITEATVCKIEAGKWLSIEMLIKLCVALDFYLFLVPKNSNDDLALIMRKRFEIMVTSGKNPT